MKLLGDLLKLLTLPYRPLGRLKLHWRIMVMLVLGAAVGGLMRVTAESSAILDGAEFAAPIPDAVPPATPEMQAEVRRAQEQRRQGPARVLSVRPESAAAKGRLAAGDVIVSLTVNKRVYAVGNLGELEDHLLTLENGPACLVHVAGQEDPRIVTLGMRPDSQLNRWLYPFRFVADVFLRLLKMLIVPLVLTSIITGVAGAGGAAGFGRLGTKTMLYYVLTSMLAITVGLVVVNVIQPGHGAQLGLGEASFVPTDHSFLEVIKRMVPVNPFEAFSSNSNMLQVIFFGILFGYFITRIDDDGKKLLVDFFNAAFEVMMKIAGFVLAMVPFGVFALIAKIVGETGYEVFLPLLKFMLTVAVALAVHAFIVLPLLLRFMGGVRPHRWGRAMSPALLTAFSTSSSAMTLPVTLESLEKRGGVSNRTSSFVAPLGATINMDGTALYECTGVLFLAQYHAYQAYQAGTIDSPEISLGVQAYVVFTALLASIGAAGIPSAGLVMMLTILSALNLPLEGAALLLSIDRPLDMCRTATNVWSDTVGTAIIARSEGEALNPEFSGAAPGGDTG